MTMTMTMPTGMPLCSVCRSLSLTTLADQGLTLPALTPSCAFCALLHDALMQSLRVRVRVLEADKADDDDDAAAAAAAAAGPVHVHLVHGKPLVVSNPDGSLTGRIRLFAPPDSPAFRSGHLVCTPPLPSPDCPEAYRLVQHWLQSCILNHPRCRETLSNSTLGKLPPFLPSRIIDVAPFPASASVRIVELKKRDRYVSLSHCWGHPENHPLTTTKASLPLHRREILWTALPKTFQHAITVVRQLRLRYLWIDSLCIVQDDPRDWEQESQKMGDIYEKATLTIGASHAWDSTEGFFWDRPASAAVTLPYHDDAGVEQGHMYASLLPDDYRTISPEFGPLSDRAWATQEWLLSRRMLFYTRECMVWSCRTVTLRETRDAFYDTARNTRWKVVVEKYSARKLTRREDRLVALQGLTNALQRRNRAPCILGVWVDALADQLLWFSTQPAQRAKSPLNLPTWTWASTLNGVRFQRTSGARSMFRCAHIVGTHVEVTGLLKPLGHLRPLPLDLETCDPLLFEVLQDAEQNLASNDARHHGAWKLTRLVSDGANDHPLGWASLDEGVVPTGQVYCLAMLGLKTAQEPGSAAKAEFRRHWVLLLVRRDEDQHDAFVRVGVAKIIERAWFADSRMRAVRIF